MRKAIKGRLSRRSETGTAAVAVETHVPRIEVDKPFVHEPLLSDRHIRLIKVPPTPSNHFKDIPGFVPPCTMIQVHLDDAPLYAAISYTWEPSAGDSYLEINQHKLKIKQNLIDLLSELGSDQSRTLWIDAICINQSDEVEKSSQVRMMGDIYASASYVIAYLWSDGQYDRMTLERGSVQIKELPFDQNRLERYVRTFDPNGGGIERLYTDYTGRLTLQDYHGLSVDDIIRWCHHRFWYRRWTVQETALARSVFVFTGKTMVPFAYLGHLRKYYHWIGIRRAFGSTPAWKRFEQREQGIVSIPLYQALSRFRDTQCAEVKDRVLALVTLSDNARRDFVVDYSLDIFALACYTLAFARKHESLSANAATGFASLLAKQLMVAPLGVVGSVEVNGLSLLDAVPVPFERRTLRLDLSNESIAEAHASLARSRLPSLASVGPQDLDLGRLLGVRNDNGEPPTEIALNDGCSMADRQVSALDAQVFLSIDEEPGMVGLAGCRLSPTDQAWALPDLSLAFIARLSTPTSGHFVGLARLFKVPESAGAAEEGPVKAVTRYDFAGEAGVDADAVSTKETEHPEVLRLSIPTLLRIGWFASHDVVV